VAVIAESFLIPRGFSAKLSTVTRGYLGEDCRGGVNFHVQIHMPLKGIMFCYSFETMEYTTLLRLLAYSLRSIFTLAQS
jgi:hypothetical protein